MSLSLYFLISLVVCRISVSAEGDPVFIQGSLQLITSDTLRWVKVDSAKEPLALNHTGDFNVICRPLSKDFHGVGLVNKINNSCDIASSYGMQPWKNFQTLETVASRVTSTLWQRPNPLPNNSIALFYNPARFLAINLNATDIGYFDPDKDFGSCNFHTEDSVESCYIFTEVLPVQYELHSVKLMKTKEFSEHDVVLDSKQMQNPMDDWNVTNTFSKPNNSTFETVLFYQKSIIDDWGQGYQMSTGLPTKVRLGPDQNINRKWGILYNETDISESVAMTVNLEPGIGINVTLKGTQVEGVMLFEAQLKTTFQDGISSERSIQGQRRLKDIANVAVAYSRKFYINSGLIVEDLDVTMRSPSTEVYMETSETYDEDVQPNKYQKLLGPVLQPENSVKSDRYYRPDSTVADNNPNSNNNGNNTSVKFLDQMFLAAMLLIMGVEHFDCLV